MAISHKPTHGTPLTPAEAAVPRNTGGKNWQAGGRFVWTSHFGSKTSNKGTREGGKGRGLNKARAADVPRPTIIPRWANKYIN